MKYYFETEEPINRPVDCPLNYEGNCMVEGCGFCDMLYGHTWVTKRPDWCPLKEVPNA